MFIEKTRDRLEYVLHSLDRISADVRDVCVFECLCEGVFLSPDVRVCVCPYASFCLYVCVSVCKHVRDVCNLSGGSVAFIFGGPRRAYAVCQIGRRDSRPKCWHRVNAPTFSVSVSLAYVCVIHAASA